MVSVEGLPVKDEEEALTLMLHHLQLAAQYFEATPEKISSMKIGDHFSTPAIHSWLDAMEQLYPRD